jgi:hypothetical protein
LKGLPTTESAGHRHLGERSLVVTRRGTHACPPGFLSGQTAQSAWAGERRAARITPSAPFTATGTGSGTWLAEIVTFK